MRRNEIEAASLFSRHERCKRREYEERIVNIERGSFTPVVLATTGACGPAADCFIKRLAGQLAEHDRQPYSTVVAWLRIRIAFALVRSAILCLRGGRSARHRPVFESREVAIAEARIYGDEWSRHQFAIQNWPSYLATLLFLLTCTHLWALSHTFWAYARTHTPAHVYPAYMHAHTFPCPVDYWANLLLLFYVYLFLSLEVFLFINYIYIYIYFKKKKKKKLRWDVYIRPWPPGWSFWRRIYTSRGSERVNFEKLCSALKFCRLEKRPFSNGRT